MTHVVARDTLVGPMTDEIPPEEGGECHGCELTKLGTPPEVLAAGPSDQSKTFIDVGGGTICDLSFKFDVIHGECNPEGCVPRLPCKIKDPVVDVTNLSRTVKLEVTNINGVVSGQPLTVTSVSTGPGQGAPDIHKELTGNGGSGTHGTSDGYTIPMICGGSTQKFRFRITYFDQGLADSNSQEFEVELQCSACTGS